MNQMYRTATTPWPTLALVAALTACGGGGDSGLPPPATPAFGTLNVYGSGDVKKNQLFVADLRPYFDRDRALNGTNGSTPDGLIDVTVVWAANGQVTYALLAYPRVLEPGSIFYGCYVPNVACTGVSYDATTRRVTFDRAVLPELTGFLYPGFDNLTKVVGGDSVVLDGAAKIN